MNRIRLSQYCVKLRNGELHAMFLPIRTDTETAVGCAIATHGSENIVSVVEEGAVSQPPLTDEQWDLAQSLPVLRTEIQEVSRS